MFLLIKSSGHNNKIHRFTGNFLTQTVFASATYVKLATFVPSTHAKPLVTTLLTVTSVYTYTLVIKQGLHLITALQIDSVYQIPCYNVNNQATRLNILFTVGAGF